MRRSESGKIGLVEVVGVPVGAAALYFGFMYLPILTHRMTMTDIARTHAAKMLVEFDDSRRREEIFERAKRETGIHIGVSELFFQRDSGTASVTIKWTEQIKHVWGGKHVIKMQVTEGAAAGAGGMKNAI